MQKMTKTFLALIAAGLLAACTQTETYPLSGEECQPGDPVQGMDAQDCLVPN